MKRQREVPATQTVNADTQSTSAAGSCAAGSTSGDYPAEVRGIILPHDFTAFVWRANTLATLSSSVLPIWSLYALWMHRSFGPVILTYGNTAASNETFLYLAFKHKNPLGSKSSSLSRRKNYLSPLGSVEASVLKSSLWTTEKWKHFRGKKSNWLNQQSETFEAN